MQLSHPRPIATQLALATCSLLSIEPAHAGFFDYDSLWNVDAGVLYYEEKDRVNVFEPVVQAKKEIADGEFVTMKFVYDSMSGATPNGATPTDQSQTFSSPSGQHGYTTAAHELPLVSFEDTRVAGSIDWEIPVSRTFRTVYGANASVETDYTSLGASASLLWDLNNKLTTLTFGAAANLDLISPTGGAPTAFSAVSTTVSAESENEKRIGLFGESEEGDGPSETKTGYDLLVGVTQVLTRKMLMQLNYGYGATSGYLTDPYKVISVIDASTGATTDYLYEKRPNSRARNTVFWKTVYQLTEDVVSVSYRYYWDDWDVRSNTVALTYRLELGTDHYLEPHYRYYDQTAAKFFRNSLLVGETPDYASADLRLAKLQSNTVGLRYAHTFDETSEWGVGIEHMLQTGDKHPNTAVGLQKNENLFSNLDATSVTVDLSIKF